MIDPTIDFGKHLADAYDEGYIDGCKEAVRQFAEKLKVDVSEDNELNEALNAYLKRDYFEYIDEVCKDAMEGKLC